VHAARSRSRGPARRGSPAPPDRPGRARPPAVRVVSIGLEVVERTTNGIPNGTSNDSANHKGARDSASRTGARRQRSQPSGAGLSKGAEWRGGRHTRTRPHLSSDDKSCRICQDGAGRDWSIVGPNSVNGPRDAETALRRFRAPGRNPREVGPKDSIRRCGCHALRIDVNQSAVMSVVPAKDTSPPSPARSSRRAPARAAGSRRCGASSR